MLFRSTRLVATALTSVAASDFLQMAYAIAQRTADGHPAPAGPQPGGRPAVLGTTAVAGP